MNLLRQAVFLLDAPNISTEFIKKIIASITALTAEWAVQIVNYAFILLLLQRFSLPNDRILVRKFLIQFFFSSLSSITILLKELYWTKYFPIEQAKT